LFIASALLLLSPRQLSAFSPPPPSASFGRRDGGRSDRSASAALELSPSSAPSSAPSETDAHDLIVIGGGSAGLTAAKFASNFGKSVALVEASRAGGDCTWTGCVPSKTLLAAAKRAWTWRRMTERYGGEGGGGADDASLRRMLEGARKEVDSARERIYEEDDSPRVLQSLGIDFVRGRAKFRDAKAVDVTSDLDGTTVRLSAKYGVVIATGASPRNVASDIAGLDAVPYWTYENVWAEFFNCIENDQQQKVSERRVIVVGGGPIGCELSQAISRLGPSVTLVSGSRRLLPAAEEEASTELRKVLEGEGVSVICDRRVASVAADENDDKKIRVSLEDGAMDPIVGDHILVATGRVPNVGNMGLDSVGIRLDPKTGGIKVDEKLETSVRGIFAAGDCTGDRQFTHYAGYQGAVAARNVLLPLKDPGVLDEVPSATFTDPEVAGFGLAERDARDRYGDDAISTSFRPLSEIDRAVCEGTDSHGFIKIVYKSGNKRILGATIVAPAAGELISELALARDAKLPLDKLATVMHAYPSYSIALQQMAADVYYDKLKKNKGLYNLLKKAGL